MVLGLVDLWQRQLQQVSRDCMRQQVALMTVFLGSALTASEAAVMHQYIMLHGIYVYSKVSTHRR